MPFKPDRVGLFDSGIGGFSILREIMAQVPVQVIDYISDDSFAPYGTKTDSAISERSHLIVETLLERGATLIVVACNSATAAAIASLRERHPDISFVGVEPYINVLNHEALFPNIEKAAVITTVLTGNSVKFRELREKLDPGHRIQHFSLPDLATVTEDIIDKGLTPELRDRLRNELAPLKEQGFSHLILGCTHYPLISTLIEKELQVETISVAPHVARRVKSLMNLQETSLPMNFNFQSTSTGSWERMTLGQLDHLLRFSRFGGVS